MPGITSAFRDDYRQAIAVGKKAASDSSFHGGSRRGGYGHGIVLVWGQDGTLVASGSQTASMKYLWGDGEEPKAPIPN